jgi:hypothetical protein
MLIAFAQTVLRAMHMVMTPLGMFVTVGSMFCWLILDDVFGPTIQYWRARYRVRSRMMDMLKQRELKEWEKYKEDEYYSIQSGSWNGIPLFMWDFCHPKRKEFRAGYDVAVAAMDIDFDVKFADEIAREKI